MQFLNLTIIAQVLSVRDLRAIKGQLGHPGLICVFFPWGQSREICV